MNTVAIDFGGTLTKIALIQDGSIVRHVTLDSKADKDFCDIIFDVQEKINHILENENLAGKIEGIGISIPGIVD